MERIHLDNKNTLDLGRESFEHGLHDPFDELPKRSQKSRVQQMKKLIKTENEYTSIISYLDKAYDIMKKTLDKKMEKQSKYLSLLQTKQIDVNTYLQKSRELTENFCHEKDCKVKKENIQNKKKIDKLIREIKNIHVGKYSKDSSNSYKERHEVYKNQFSKPKRQDKCYKDRPYNDYNKDVNNCSKRGFKPEYKHSLEEDSFLDYPYEPVDSSKEKHSSHTFPYFSIHPNNFDNNGNLKSYSSKESSLSNNQINPTLSRSSIFTDGTDDVERPNGNSEIRINSHLRTLNLESPKYKKISLLNKYHDEKTQQKPSNHLRKMQKCPRCSHLY